MSAWVWPQLSHATRQEHASVCVQRTNQDGILSIRFVRHVPLISQLWTDKQVHANLALNWIQFGINLHIGVSLARRTLILTETSQSASLARMMKNTTKLRENVFRFANHIRFTTSKRENVILCKSLTDANAINVTTPHWRNVRMHAITVSIGCLRKRNADHLHFQNSKISANIINAWIRKLTNVKTIVTVRSLGTIVKTTFA